MRDLVLADLERAQRLIAKIGDEIGPPVPDRLAGGRLVDRHHAVQGQECAAQLKLFSRFMAWKTCPAFTQAAEIAEPDAVVCIGVSHREMCGFMALIQRKPLRFSRPMELSRTQIGDVLPALLPRGAVSLQAEEIRELREYFRGRRRVSGRPYYLGAHWSGLKGDEG